MTLAVEYVGRMSLLDTARNAYANNSSKPATAAIANCMNGFNNPALLGSLNSNAVVTVASLKVAFFDAVVHASCVDAALHAVTYSPILALKSPVLLVSRTSIAAKLPLLRRVHAVSHWQ